MRDDDLLLLDDDDEPDGADPFDPLGLGSMEPDFPDDDELDLPPQGQLPDDDEAPTAVEPVAAPAPASPGRTPRWDEDRVGKGIEEDEAWAPIPVPAATLGQQPGRGSGRPRASRPGRPSGIPSTRGKLNVAPRRGMPRAAVGAMAVAAIGLPGLLLVGRSTDAQTAQATSAPRTVTVAVPAPTPTKPAAKPVAQKREQASTKRKKRATRPRPARRKVERQKPVVRRSVAPRVVPTSPPAVAVAPRPRRVDVAPAPAGPSRATKSQVTSSFGLGR